MPLSMGFRVDPTMFCQTSVVSATTLPVPSISFRARCTSSIGLLEFTLILYETFVLSGESPRTVRSTGALAFAVAGSGAFSVLAAAGGAAFWFVAAAFWLVEVSVFIPQLLNNNNADIKSNALMISSLYLLTIYHCPPGIRYVQLAS